MVKFGVVVEVMGLA